MKNRKISFGFTAKLAKSYRPFRSLLDFFIEIILNPRHITLKCFINLLLDNSIIFSQALFDCQVLMPLHKLSKARPKERIELFLRHAISIIINFAKTKP